MTRKRPDTEQLTAKIPADVDRPDRILYGLNARQLLILAATALLACWIYLTAGRWLPVAATVAAIFPVVVVGVVLAVFRRDGMSMDRYLTAALAHTRAAKARVWAPDPIEPPPAWCRMRGTLPVPLRLPVRAVRDDGVMELAEGGTAVIVKAGTVAFGLRTSAEQAALVAVFGRWLNSLDGSVQILVQARPVDLSDLVNRLEHAAPALPHPDLEQAARDHAAFLADLNDSRDLLMRQVLIVLHDHAATGGRKASRQAGAAVLLRRAEETVRALTVLGVTAHVLDAAACTAVLAESLSPGDIRPTGLASPDDVITVKEARP